MTIKITNIRTEHSTETNAWWYLTTLNHFLQDARLKYENPSEGMNISIILNSATIIEGFLYETLSTSLYSINDEHLLSNRLELELKERIEKASWNDLNNLYKLIFNKDLSKIISPETWKDTQSLFDFRNMIVHGKTLKISNYTENGISKIKIHGKYAKIYNYLLTEKKIINHPIINNDNYPTISLITNEISDFYWKTACDFINILCIQNNTIKERTIKRLNELLVNKIESPPRSAEAPTSVESI